MALEGWIQALELLTPVAKAVPVLGAPVEGSLEAAGKILKFAQSVKTNKEQSRELAEQAARWTQALVNALNDVKTDATELERMRPDVTPIREMLDTIATTMERRVRQSKATQMLNKSKNEEELTKLKNDLKDAYERFMVSSQIRAQSALATLITAADADTLGKLTPISAARYDSLASPPGCLEGTRQEILAEMFTWAEEPSQGMSVFWLAGLAGTGKSTIAKTFCERLAAKGTLIATFFASRNSAERRDPLNVIHTFAYELATADPQIRPHVLSAVRSPPDIMQRPMQEQIGRLLAASLSQARNGGTLVLVIDALDECDRIGRVEGGALIPMLAEALRNLPVKLLVTSRQEKSVVGMFESLDHIPLRFHEVATEVVEPDVRQIFETGFAENGREHELIADSWPSQEDVDPLWASDRHRPFKARLTWRAGVFAIIAIQRMSMLSRAWFSRLEALVHHGVDSDVQKALDILDRALFASDTSRPAYGRGVRRLRWWCKKYALLPTSFDQISMHDIQLESKAKAMTGFSDVFCGVYHDGTRVAVKVLREYATGNSLEAVQKSFRNEVVTWRHLRHPNIVPFLGVCDKSTLCLVSHWMEEGTLLDFFARHPRERRTSYMLGTIRGLDFMHSLGVVHGDIKAINILVDEKQNARLADFGLASALSNGTIAATHMTGGGGKGTVPYMAPELIIDEQGVRTEQSDVYALATTIWKMFSSQPPFFDISNHIALSLRVIQGGRPLKPTGCENIGLTDDLWEVVQRGWAKELSSRPALSAFMEVLEV